MIRATRGQRGQTIALAAITMLILALTVFITFNVAHAIRNRIRLQNYADAKAFTVAVQEARALNYFAYTNRAIASSYVAMANMHAYMSEAAMLADADGAGAAIMAQVASTEWDMCYCCCTPFGCAPCCFQHCIDSVEAAWYSAMFAINYVSGNMGSAIQELEDPFRQTMDALQLHIDTIHLSQQDVKLQLELLLANNGELPTLKVFNLGDAPVNDGASSLANNVSDFNGVFFTDDEKKKRIMAEVVNATRPGFTWNRKGNTAAVTALMQPAMLQRMRDTAGGEGIWTVTQPTMITTGGRTAATDGEFPNQAGGVVVAATDPDPGADTGNTMASYDYGSMQVTPWRHATGTMLLPLFGPMGAAEMFSGDTNRHRIDDGLDFFNSPHSGADHDDELDMSKFMEFDIDANKPYHQPSYIAVADADVRYTDTGSRLVFEISESGHLTYQVGDSADMTGDLQLSDDKQAHAVAKAMVYYHRIGNWADYPNLFNPYWRVKLEPMTTAEAGAILPIEDTDSGDVAVTFQALPGGPDAVNIH